MIRDYYYLTKPGLVYGNLIPVIGGFALGIHETGESISLSNFIILIAALIGLCLVMGSGCVFNNVIDQKIDGEMARTKNRPLVTGRISRAAALWFGFILGVVGLVILGLYTNSLIVAVAGFGWFAYVILYSLWSKRQTVYGTIIGSLSGAVPPVIGYTAISGRLDYAGAILFLILVTWQMPHFFAIGIYRRDDYAAASIPILPVKNGVQSTKRAMLFYILAFIVAACLLTIFGYANNIYLIIAFLLGAGWFSLSVKGFWISDADIKENERWARQMFFTSLIVLLGLFITMVTTSI